MYLNCYNNSLDIKLFPFWWVHRIPLNVVLLLTFFFNFPLVSHKDAQRLVIPCWVNAGHLQHCALCCADDGHHKGKLTGNSTLTNSILRATCVQRITTSVFKHSNDKVFHSEKTKLKEVAMEMTNTWWKLGFAPVRASLSFRQTGKVLISEPPSQHVCVHMHCVKAILIPSQLGVVLSHTPTAALWKSCEELWVNN